MIKNLLVFILSISVLWTFAQENKIDQYKEKKYFSGLSYFDMSLYADADQSLNAWVETPDVHPFGDFEKLRREAILTSQIANLRIEDPTAESKLLYYISEFYPDPVTVQPILELASHYYYQRNYQAAIDWYEKIDVSTLPVIDKSEALFKKGYCHFVKKEFNEAHAAFQQIKDYQNIFYYPSNYYFGMSQYFTNDFDGAVKSFKKVANSDYYGDFIPYYLSQIYFAQKELDLLISYGEQKITEPGVKNKKNIRLLLGQAYYIRGDFERALSHLEFYEANTEKLTIEEFYQLAFTQYKLGKFEKAKENFLELTYQDTKLGQLSNYYLADCYIKLGDKSSARSIFKKVSQMPFDKGMQEEATFNYGKISAEQGFEREAINIFIEIPESSPYYAESQDVIYDILVNSGDYLNSISIMESLPKLTKKLQGTYQNLTLKKAIQFYSEEQFGQANIYFDKSLKYNNERLYSAQTYYWMAKMSYDKNDYPKALEYLDQYHAAGNGLSDLPEESSNYMANYLQAYCYLKQKDFAKAEVRFKNAIVGLNINNQDIQNEYINNRVLPDALIRAGDCLFKQSKYQNAKSFYEQSITRKQPGFDYALYQKALIDGLLGEPYEKIVTLEKITAEHPESKYADDAYYQIGETYLGLGSMEPAAIAFIDLMAKHGPNSNYYGQAQLKMGLINYNKGDLNKALDYYKSVFNYNPTTKQKVEAMNAIEEIYVKDLKNSKKYFSFTDSIPGFEIDEFSKDSLTYHIAFDQYSRGDYENALISFNDYNDRYINGFYKVEAHYFRGEILSILKQFSRALKDYEYVIDFPQFEFYPEANLKAGVIAFNVSEEFDKALTYYANYENTAPDDAESFKAQLGALKSAFKLSNNEKVVNYANKVNGNDLATTNERAMALYYLGKVQYRQNNFNEAQAAFSQVSKMVNNNHAAEAKYLLSEIYFKNGDLELAEKQCNFNNETSLNYPFWVAKSIILLSDIYQQREDLINARAALEAVLENFKDDEQLQEIASEKLKVLEKKEAEADRIKVNDPGVLELDSIGGK